MSGHEKYIPAWGLQSVGLVLLIASAAFWAISGRQSALLIGAAMTLIGVGAYRSLTKSILDRGPDRDRDDSG